MRDKNLFNKFKDREDLDFEYDYGNDDDDWGDDYEDYDDEEDFDDYNDGEWDEEI